MAAPAVSDQATENNQRLFRRYGRMFHSNDPGIYALHAHKLSVWLGDFKAYYQEARPEIIKLLLIAQVTLRRSLNIPLEITVPFNIYNYPDNPFKASYVKLVNAILPFQSMFVEPSLADHIRSLQASIAEPGQGTSQVVYPLLPSNSPIASSLTAFSAVPGPAPSHTNATTGNVPHEPEIQIFGNPGATPSTSSNMQAQEPVSAPVRGTSQMAQHASATAPVRRVKKRKTLDLDALAQTDIQGLLSKQEQVAQAQKHAAAGNMGSNMNNRELEGQPTPSELATPQHVPAVVGPEIGEQQTTHTGEQLLIAATGMQDATSLEDHGPVAPGPEIQEMPTAYTVEEPPVVQTGRHGVASTQELTPATSGSEIVDMQAVQEVEHSPLTSTGTQDVSAVEIHVRAAGPEIVEIQTGHTAEPFATAKTDIAPTKSIAVPGGLHKLDTPRSSIEPDAPTEPSTVANIEDNTMTSEGLLDLPMEVDNQETEQINEGTVGMDVDTETAGSKSDHSTQEPPKDDQQTPNSGLSTDAIEQPSNGSPPVTLPDPSAEPSVSVNFDDEVHLHGDGLVNQDPTEDDMECDTPEQDDAPIQDESSQLQTTEVGTPANQVNEPENPHVDSNDDGNAEPGGESTSFGADMRVVAIEKGKAEASFVRMHFDIPESDFHRLLVWVKRTEKTTVEEIRLGFCISLGCYLISDLVTPDFATLEKGLSCARSTWPSEGALVMNVTLDGSKQTLPLSPPLQVTPDGLVDVSGFLNVGTNVFELHQYQDLSHYVFVLHAHHPTGAQISQLKDISRKDKEWDDWLENMSRPFETPRAPSIQTHITSA